MARPNQYPSNQRWSRRIAKNLLREGHNLSEIAQLLGVTRQAISEAKKRGQLEFEDNRRKYNEVPASQSREL